MPTDLDKLYYAYEKDESVPLKNLRASATQFVRGVGPINPDIMLIGEAPGRDEDKVGEPFVGKAGEVLDTLFLRAKIKREDAFITNVVKYRPVNELDQNRTPSTPELAVSRRYVQKEIEIVNPKVIGLMGRPSIQTFYPLHSPKESHGKVIYNENFPPIVFLFHPAVGAYNPKMIQVLIDDFQQLVRELHKL